MTAEIGHLALILAMMTSLVGAVFPLAGAALGVKSWQRLAPAAAYWSAALSLTAIGSLAWGFYFDDFSIMNVVQHSNSKLPWFYKLSAVWGSHEGSILFWVWVLTLWNAGVAWSARKLAAPVTARVLGILSAIAFGLFLFILTTSNPFLRYFPPAFDGADLNPLLQDPGMIFHPPLLYVGYVGFAVPFAFAMAALLSGRFDLQWARWMRPWTALSWVLLTLGISLGSYWSYYELGWGGWWAWDPVENSSFMPWLTGTALMHSLIATEKRGVFKLSTVFLAILTFSLSLLGTFLVRSGVLTSVHAFASDPERGLFILIFLILVVGASFLVFAAKGARLAHGARFGFVSKESMLMTGNALLVVAMGTVLLGTMYPLLIDAMGLGKLSVGSPYFNAVFGSMMIFIALAMPPSIEARWVDMGEERITTKLLIPGMIALIAALAMPFMLGSFKWSAGVGFGLSVWIAAGTLMSLWRYASWAKKAGKAVNIGFIAMVVAHLGVATTMFGATAVEHYAVERQVRMLPGTSVTIDPVTIRYNGWTNVQGPNYSGARGSLTVFDKAGRELFSLHPEKRNYDNAKGMTMTEAAIVHSPVRDVYVSMGTPTDDNRGWVIRAYVKPFVIWIWIGTLMMAVGGVLAMFARRGRKRDEKADEAALHPALEKSAKEAL